MKSKTTRRIGWLTGMICAAVLMLAMGITALATAETGSTIYVKGDNTNIRSGASTDSEVVGQLNANAPLTVLGITSGTDGRNWYQVECVINGETKTGYIREDLVEIPAEPEEPNVTDNPEPGTPDVGTPDNTGNVGDNSTQAASLMSDLMPLEPEGEPQNLPVGFTKMTIKTANGELPAWSESDGSNEYIVLYASNTKTGSQGWYLYDSIEKSYVRYADFIGAPVDGGSVSSNGGGVSGVAFGIVIVICVGLVIVTLCMGLKLMNAGGRDDDDDYDDYDDDEDYDDDDDEDYDDDEEDYDDRRVTDRETHNVVVQQRHFTQPQQRPVSQGQARPSGQQRPVSQGQARPAGQQGASGQVRPAGQQRPVSQVQARPAGQTGQGQQRYAQRQAGQQRYAQRTTPKHDDEY